MSARELHGDELSPGRLVEPDERRVSEPTDRMQASDAPAASAEHLVLAALENPRHKWRTLEDLCRDTGLDGLTVYRVLHRHEDVVQSSHLTLDGYELFATWRHYRKHSTFLERLGAAFRSRAA